MSTFDEELALAISLSLQEQNTRATNSKEEPIMIIDSSDDDEIISITDSPYPPKRPTASSSKAIPSIATTSATPRKAIPAEHKPEINEVDTATEDEDDTATEDESNDEVEAKPVVPPVIGKGKSVVRGRPLPASSVKSQPSKSASLDPASASNPGESTVGLSPAAAFRAERAKMEQERLARLKRRRPDLASQSNDDGNNMDEDEDELEQRPSKRPSPAISVSPSVSSSGGNSATKENMYAGSFNVSDKSGCFWHGALRQTANKHAIPSQDTKPVFRLTTDILPPINPTESSKSTANSVNNALSFAIVSSFSLDLPWLHSLLPPGVPVIVITQPGPSGRAEVHYTLPNWVRTSPALAGGRGCMHVKLIMLFYKTGRLRVVIPTANFVPYDWRDIENTVWLQDVPLRTTPASSSEAGASTGGAKVEGFAESLERVLKALNVVPALEAHLTDQRASGEVGLPLRSIDELHTRWDWSRVTARLIPSLAGKHTGWPSVLLVGHVALMKAIRDMGAASKRVTIECQGSSIGSYSSAWTNEFISSAKGVSPDTWLDTPKSRRSKAPHPIGLKIIFPSLRTVDASVLGREGGGTMFCNRKQWDASTFPKTHFFDSNSKRGRILMHSKMILGLPKSDSKSSAEKEPKAWLYSGSHNFTPSAWGNLSGSGFTPVMNVTNYELGIIIPLESEAQGDDLACWKRPARPYVEGEDVPWMQTEYS